MVPWTRQRNLNGSRFVGKDFKVRSVVRIFQIRSLIWSHFKNKVKVLVLPSLNQSHFKNMVAKQFWVKYFLTGWILEIQMFDLKADLVKWISYSLAKGLERSKQNQSLEPKPDFHSTQTVYVFNSVYFFQQLHFPNSCLKFSDRKMYSEADSKISTSFNQWQATISSDNQFLPTVSCNVSETVLDSLEFALYANIIC